MKQSGILLFCCWVFLFPACSEKGDPGKKAQRNTESSWPGGVFDTYWRQGKAEISRFTLSQNRYRDNHPGEAIQIFVTEDFLPDIQVKNERYARTNSLPVLKLNAIQRFTTGIYDYSVMSSVFSPIRQGLPSLPLKITNSAQDWCGQTYMQANRFQNRLKIQWNSYFELEGDKTIATKALPMEDGLWSQIRMDPDALPKGRLQMLPSLAFIRLMHIAVKGYAVEARVYSYGGKEFPGEDLMVYRVYYPELQRTLEIIYEGQQPFRISGWKDTFPSPGDKKLRSTIAVRTHVLLNPYWQFNNRADTVWRDTLGVQGYLR